MRHTPDYYRILSLAEGATVREIHGAYRVLALRFHPDRNPGPEAAARMRLINEAYACLSDDVARRNFDESLRAPEPTELQEAVLDAAGEVLDRSGWSSVFGDGRDITLTGPSGRVFVRSVGLCGEADTAAWLSTIESFLRSGGADCAVLLAFRILDVEGLGRVSRDLAGAALAIDLVESRSVGEPLANPGFGELFRPFLVSDGPG